MEKTSFVEKENLFKVQTGIDFQATFKKYHPKLLYYVNKMCMDEQESEDITMDAFMMALDKIEKYDKTKSQFSTWLFTIARNITLQRIKENKRNVSIDVEIDNEGTTMKDFISFESPSYFEDIIVDSQTIKADIIKREMDNLKDPYKTIIHMREIQGMPYKDISEKLGRNLSTVKSQIRGARKILIQKTERDFKLVDQGIYNI